MAISEKCAAIEAKLVTLINEKINDGENFSMLVENENIEAVLKPYLNTVNHTFMICLPRIDHNFPVIEALYVAFVNPDYIYNLSKF